MVFDFLFPSYTCLVCGGELNAPQGVLLCDGCAEGLPINTEAVTLKDEKQKQYFYKAYAAFRYTEPVVGLVLRLKYNAEGHVVRAVAPYMAGALLYKNPRPAGTPFTKGGIPLLVPVPLSKKREKQREYNQALLLAKELSKVLNLPVVDSAIQRVKATEAQKDMTVEERARNLKNAFVVTDKQAVKGKHVILVDDVFTSGSTANECARILRKADARRVDVVVVAAVV